MFTEELNEKYYNYFFIMVQNIGFLSKNCNEDVNFIPMSCSSNKIKKVMFP
jgi:hypothetical protein